MDLSFTLTCLLGLLAITNPPGAIPAYLSLRRASRHSNTLLIRITAATVLSVLLLFGFTGQAVLGFFGVSMAAFRAAGGVLLLLMAISMLHGTHSRVKQTPEELDEATHAQDASQGIVPLGLPLISGPGAITAVILMGHQADGWDRRLGLLLAIVLVAAAVWLTLTTAERLHNRIGQMGINILTRFMGLILAAMAVQFIFDGVKQALPGLAG